VGLTECNRAHDHARRAETALQAMTLAESLLHGMEAAVGPTETLDGHDVTPFHLHEHHIAGLDGLAINQDRTGTALGGITAHMGTGQSQMLAQRLRQQGMGRLVKGNRLAVDLKVDGHLRLLFND
jgi:hypothetical protein